MFALPFNPLRERIDINKNMSCENCKKLTGECCEECKCNCEYCSGCRMPISCPCHLKDTPRISKCCKAPLEVVGGDEGTMHYECTKCKNASDPIYEDTPKPSWEEKWNDMRGTVIVTKDSTPLNPIIDISAMEKRDIDFISSLLQEQKDRIALLRGKILSGIEMTKEEIADELYDIIKSNQRE